jgi:hypothetical protein
MRLRGLLPALAGCGLFGGGGVSPEQARQELLTQVSSLRQAQLDLQVVDDFLPCGDADTARASASRVPRAWEGPDCFARIGWAPEGLVVGGYWVEVAPDGEDFTVHGVADPEGDGTFLHVTATRASPAAVAP